MEVNESPPGYLSSDGILNNIDDYKDAIKNLNSDIMIQDSVINIPSFGEVKNNSSCDWNAELALCQKYEVFIKLGNYLRIN